MSLPIAATAFSLCLLLSVVNSSMDPYKALRIIPNPNALDNPHHSKLPLIVFYHGGGFIFYSAASTYFHDFCVNMAKNTQSVVVSVDYRLAPEHRLPAAYEDSVEALHWIKTSNDPWLTRHADYSRCYLMGESAGGNIAYFAGLGADRDHEYSNPTVNGGAKVLDKIKLLGWKVAVFGCHGDPLVDRQVELVKLLEKKGVHVVGHFYDGGRHGIFVGDPSMSIKFAIANEPEQWHGPWGEIYLNGSSQAFSLNAVDPFRHLKIALNSDGSLTRLHYRLAPEHRLPAAYDDAVEALHWIKTQSNDWLRNYADYSNCYLMGSSAGANIAYHAALRVAAEASDLMWELALPVGVDRDHEYCNPTAGNGPRVFDRVRQVGWRVLVTGCDGDPLVDHQIALARLIEEKGVEVVKRFGSGGCHGVEGS
ncbi:Alpha/Beta hydrolase fold [Sesbania bispinosa]|nr:Alpha/Beta hydrolase fold [Sesbania bispinosa]